jgi:hypothetical protein
MNPWMISDLADSRAREIRRQAAECRTGRRRPVPRPAYGVNHWLRLRHRVGYGLVEAGLHVLASTRPAP